MNKAIEFLKTVAIFTSFTEKELNIIYKGLKQTRVKKSRNIFKEGDQGNELFIVQSGIMGCSIQCPDGSQKELATYEPGDFFGEMSIFENAPRSATIYAKDDSILYKYNDKDFFKLLESHPDFAIKIMYKMLKITTQRLRNTSKFLSDMVRWGNDASKRAVTDEMTGVYNRRYLDNALVDIFNRARSENKPLSFIMIDLDYFREINNCYSHKMGDQSILEVVKAFKKHLREQDSMARYGGDEFTVILRDTDSQTAFNLAEKIRKEVTEVDILKNLGGKITTLSLSMGVAAFPEHASTLADLKLKADAALYQAKEQGRNRVIISSDGVSH
ncbi:MAG: GGDEF domain-containing protein [Spirochaetales bacterium]|nr:GGDEF domain-containing protein [Spirochaetales bacterium]